jgi:SAM-dependent methyltransferase
MDVAANAVERAGAHGLDAKQIDDAGSLPLADRSVSVVTLFEVLEHLLDPESALREIRRVLAPDGRLLITVPNAAYWVRRVELGAAGRFNPYGDDQSLARPWRDPHLRFFTLSALRGLLIESGFHILESGGHGHAVFSVRTRIEGTSPIRLLMRLAPSVFAPTLSAVATYDPDR